MHDQNVRLSYEEFTKRAIVKLRNLNKSRGIHSVYSGFNNAFRKYYDEDPIPITSSLAEQGLIVIQPRKGGVMLYLPGEEPVAQAGDVDNIIDTILFDE